MIFLKNKQKILQDEIEQKDTFVATIVHDLKNPLIAHARILECIIKKSGDEFVKEKCMQMLTSARLMLAMVFSVSDTYRQEKGKPKYNFEEVNLLEMTKEVCFELSSLTDEESLLNIKATENPIVFADKMHIRRVISNLISNAIRYKKENTNIVIEIVNRSGFVIFQVINQGHYIKPEMQKELFKKYVTSKSTFHSTGLGLYISEQIIKAHEGKMFVKSDKTGKNVFGFCVPVKKSVLKRINKIINR